MGAQQGALGITEALGRILHGRPIVAAWSAGYARVLIRMRTTPPEHVDVLIVGAGLSGIGAACHLERRCPGRTYAILEAREAIGGTWDLFRYPGIRSDSDMYTLGYSFRPWEEAKSIADGPSILHYVRDTARRRRDRASGSASTIASTGAHWSTTEARWTVEAERGERVRPCGSAAGSCSCAAATTATTRATRPTSPGPSGSPARSCTRRSGRRTSTTPASAWWSSAAAQPR